MNVDGTWRKSSYSGGQGGNCVEVAVRPAGQMAVRDSKDQAGPMLGFPRETWGVFTAGIKGRHKSALPRAPARRQRLDTVGYALIIVASQPA